MNNLIKIATVLALAAVASGNLPKKTIACKKSATKAHSGLKSFNVAKGHDTAE